MAAKKFLTTFIIMIFCFLIGSGIALTYMINNAEARANEKAKEALEQGIELLGKTTNNSDWTDPYINTLEPFNFLILVKDKVGANTDALLLLNIDPVNKKISAMSIPRDTIISADFNSDGDKDIINTVYANLGLKGTIDYIGNELNCNIKYAAVMNLKAFREVIDQLGGVDFNLPFLMDYDDVYQNLHIYFEPGLQHFNGEDAEKLLRFRKNNEGVKSNYVNGSDIQRIAMQQSFIKALIEQKTNLFYFAKVNSIIQTIFDNLDTNITFNDIYEILPIVLEIDLTSIEWFRLPGHDDTDFIHYVPEPDNIREIILSNFKGTSN